MIDLCIHKALNNELYSRILIIFSRIFFLLINPKISDELIILMQKLSQKREHIWQENRKTDRERVLGQHRKKFLDLTDLLVETNLMLMSNHQTNTHLVTSSLADKMNELLYADDKSILSEGEDVVKAIALAADSPSIAHKCQCTDELIALLKEKTFTLTEISFKIILRACVQLMTRQPMINYQMGAALLNAFIGKINIDITINDIVSQIFLNLLLYIPLGKRTQIFYQHRKLLQFVVQMLPRISSTDVTNRYIIYLDTIFSGCDEDTRDILLQNLELIKIFVKSLNYYSEITDSVLSTISNLALNGSDMVDFLIHNSLVPALLKVFQNSKASTQNLVVVVFYNLVLSSNSNQIVYLCQNGLMQIIDYCLNNQINLQCLQLALKLVEKLVVFIDRKYVRNMGEQNPREVLRRTVNPKLENLKHHTDSFVNELTKKIDDMLNPDSMQTE